MPVGWRMFFKANYKGNPFVEGEKFYDSEFGHLVKGPYLCPKQMYERVAPGKFRRQYKKETLRKADWAKVREIVSTIFVKKGIRYPPASIKDLGWDKKIVN